MKGGRGINRRGQVYGKWEVRQIAGYHIHGHRVWHVRNVETLEGAKARICGRAVHFVKDEAMVPPEWVGTARSWWAMVTRCTRKTKDNYQHYGGQGVRCHEWWLPGKANTDRVAALAQFVKDMGIRPSGTSLDRIDPYGDYTPDNCRWADKWVQARNRRDGAFDADAVNECAARPDEWETTP